MCVYISAGTSDRLVACDDVTIEPPVPAPFRCHRHCPLSAFAVLPCRPLSLSSSEMYCCVRGLRLAGTVSSLVSAVAGLFVSDALLLGVCRVLCVWMSVLVVASRSCRSTACGTGATVTQPMRRRRHRADYGIASEEPRGYQVAAVCDLGCFKPSTRAVLKQPVHQCFFFLSLLPSLSAFLVFLL